VSVQPDGEAAAGELAADPVAAAGQPDQPVVLTSRSTLDRPARRGSRSWPQRDRSTGRLLARA
jgi:hypothetical protein